MDIWICEDSKTLADSLADIINGWAELRGEHVDIASFQTGEVMLERELQPDILFLDVKLPGISGEEAARQLRDKNRELVIIFFTAYSEYMRSALELHAFDFLEKPITKDRVFGTLDDIAALKRPRVGKNIMLETDKGVHVISSGEILYAERMARKILVVTGEAQFLAKATLAGLYDELNSMGFVYCHRGCLVNLEQIVEIEGNRLVFPDGRGCEIARQRIKDVRTAWIECMRDRQG